MGVGRQRLRNVVGMGLLAAGWLAVGGPVASADPGSRHVPASRSVKAVTPPRRVARALAATQMARYVVLHTVSQTGSLSYEVDRTHGRALTLSGHRVSLIQIGAKVYQPELKSGCFMSADHAASLLPNIAGMLLPSGIPNMHYTLDGKTIGWTVKTPSGYRPHGRDKVNAAGRIVSATVYSGPGVPLTATVLYPAREPKIAAPRTLCARSRSGRR